MYIALDKDKNVVYAHLANKDLHYFCPICGSKVNVKKGAVNAPHFSHQHIKSCTRYLYKSESEAHLEAKHDLYLRLNQEYNVTMEHYLHKIDQIPDILLNEKIAIEIQFSPISPTLILNRTRGYHSLNIKVIWILNDADFNATSITHFQHSTMQAQTIYTYCLKKKLLYKYLAKVYKGQGKYHFKKTIMNDKEFIDINNQLRINSSKYYLSDYEISHIIRLEKLKKSVLNTTLSSLYRLQLSTKTIPKQLKVVVDVEKLILNNPLEWKLYLYEHILNRTFHFQNFKKTLKLRPLSHNYNLDQIAKMLIKAYIELNLDILDINDRACNFK